jgi:polysaccharide export outer membrane protein
MSHRRTGALLAVFTLAACLFVGGCQSTSPLSSILSRHGSGAAAPAVASGPVLAPGMEVEWHIKSANKESGEVDSGRGYIAADGTIELGPYGKCHIGGMPAAQARSVLEKHLARYINTPAVQVTTPTRLALAEELPWRKARSSVLGGGAVRPVAFQTPSTPAEKTDTEVIGPPRVLVPPALAMPHDLVGVPPVATATVATGPAPNECRPTLLPPYVIGPTDVLLIQSTKALQLAPVGGPHLVGPDGRVIVGAYGPVPVAGLTLEQARVAVSQAIQARLNPKEEGNTLEDVMKYTSVDVMAYNSRQFYIVADGGGLGEQVIPLPITGNDYVLNAIGKINGLPLVASKHHIWVARATCPGCPETRLPVDWIGITQRGEGVTNWQLMPGDRVYVQADVVRTFNNQLAKFLAPVNQLFGTALLSSQTINSIKSGSVTGNR